jgi:hypothetical protein
LPIWSIWPCGNGNGVPYALPWSQEVFVRELLFDNVYNFFRHFLPDDGAEGSGELTVKKVFNRSLQKALFCGAVMFLGLGLGNHFGLLG